LGVASFADFFVVGLRRIVDVYVRGFSVAWDGWGGEGGVFPFGGDDPQVVDGAAYHIAQGDDVVVVVLVGVIVAYLTRGGGNAR
ncbi:hypothetical protein RA263_28495, partial [Pseudomonas syringae pv. tagetis]|uniref:DUF6861 domain-containing protein n=1 Tax=Pseudomonas syringae group genomosp. 7 TaxID=251699 RepID=UPI00376FBE9C